MSANDRIDALERKLFNLSTGQTVGIAVVTVLALALAGVLAGTLMRRDAIPLDTRTPDDGSMVGLALNANASKPAATLAARAPASAGVLFSTANSGNVFAQTLVPEPVASEPGVASPTPAAPSPAPSPAPPPGTPGTGVDLSGIVTVPTPPPWVVNAQSPTDALLADGRNNFVYAVTGTFDPASDASAQLLPAFVSLVASQEQMTQLRYGDPVAIAPFGSMVSAAVMPYEGLWTDSQGSFELRGNLWMGIRQDGAALAMTAETTPPTDFDASRPEWGPVIEGAYGNFAGLP